MRPEYIKVGQIVNAHGIRGDLKLNPYRVDVTLLTEAKHFYIDGKAVKPSSLRVHKNTLLFRMPGVEDMDTALSYKGKDVMIRPAEMDLPEGVYFDDEIIGLTVLDADSGAEIGKVTDVMAYPAHDVYEVKGEKSYLIPAVGGVFIEEIDVDGGIIRVHMMEGLETDAR